MNAARAGRVLNRMTATQAAELKIKEPRSYFRADTGKANRAFGYAPTVSPADGLRAQIAWHRARRAERR